jgi:hypothetical protein
VENIKRWVAALDQWTIRDEMKFTFQRQLGEGGQAKVYKVTKAAGTPKK